MLLCTIGNKVSKMKVAVLFMLFHNSDNRSFYRVAINHCFAEHLFKAEAWEISFRYLSRQYNGKWFIKRRFCTRDPIVRKDIEIPGISEKNTRRIFKHELTAIGAGYHCACMI